jgi:hypothetical protein
MKTKLYDELDNVRRREAWAECCAIFPENPFRMYRSLYKGWELPMTPWNDNEYWDGTTNTDDDSHPVGSYNAFEIYALQDKTANEDEFYKLLHDGDMEISNRVFVDANSSKAITVSRYEMNIRDGYIQHDLLSGKIPDYTMNEAGASWYTSNNPRSPRPTTGSVLFSPQIIAGRCNELGFGLENVGSSDYFFESRNDFMSAFSGQATALEYDSFILNDAVNPDFIGFRVKPSVYQYTTFSDIDSYCAATGYGYPFDMYSALSMINYFTHEVLNALLPQRITLLMESVGRRYNISGYVPCFYNKDKDHQITDHANRLKHIGSMMNLIAQGRILPQSLGRFRLKLTITPAVFTVHFVMERAPNIILLTTLPVIDNAVLYDVEINHSLDINRFIFNGTRYNYLPSHQATGNDSEIIKNVGFVYSTQLAATDTECDDIDNFI